MEPMTEWKCCWWRDAFVEPQWVTWLLDVHALWAHAGILTQATQILSVNPEEVLVPHDQL